MKSFTSPLLLAGISVASVCLTGCAMQEGDFPSLEKRPYEDAGAVTDVPVAPAPPVISTLPADIQRQLDSAISQSNTAHAKFLSNLPTVRRRVQAARGSAVSSEAWVVAQMDLAALEITRSPSVDALADADRIYLARLDSEFEEADPGGAAIIADQKQRIEQQVSEQQTAIDGMKQQLR